MISLTERTWTEIHPQNILHNMKMIRDSVPGQDEHGVMVFISD